MTNFSEQKMIELAKWLQKKADSSIGTVFDTEIGYWMQDQALNLHSIIDELTDLQKKASRYEFWRKYYNCKFVLILLPNNTSRLSFDAWLPAVQPAGSGYEIKVDSALDEAIQKIEQKEHL